MKKYIIPLSLGFSCFIYGIMIVKYEVFPYQVIKYIQDKFEENELKHSQIETLKLEGYEGDVNSETLISVYPNNTDSIRKKLTNILFGKENLPKSLPDTIFELRDTVYSDLGNLKRLEQFEIVQKYGIKSIGYIFHPKKHNNRLIIYHQGHKGDFFHGKSTLEYFIDKGFTIYAFCMPLRGKNNQPTIKHPKLGNIKFTHDHGYFQFLKNPLKYFISPVISMINYSDSQNFKDISMIGISGGGWTTTLTAAVDTRISNSFPVADSSPMYIRFENKKLSDFEQMYPDLYSNINYLDLYILGSVGQNRKQVKILNTYDPCCFSGRKYESYERSISNVVKEFMNGSFEVFPDSSHFEHKISELALIKINKVINSTPNK